MCNKSPADPQEPPAAAAPSQPRCGGETGNRAGAVLAPEAPTPGGQTPREVSVLGCFFECAVPRPQYLLLTRLMQNVT